MLAAAGTGGILYWISIYPIDVVKSALQTDNIDPSKRNYANSLDAAKVGGKPLAESNLAVAAAQLLLLCLSCQNSIVSLQP